MTGGVAASLCGRPASIALAKTVLHVKGVPPLSLTRACPLADHTGLDVSDSVKAELLALRPQNFTGRCFVQKR